MKSYLKHKILNLIEIKSLMAVEYLEFEGKYKNYVEKHNFWELCYVEKGKIDLIIEDETESLEKNSLFLIPPQKNHSYCAAGDEDNKVFVICFQCSSQALIPLSQTKLDLSYEIYGYMRKIISESFATFYTNEEGHIETVNNPVVGGQQMIILYLECIFITLLRLLATKEKADIVFLNEDNFKQNLVDAIISYMECNIDKKLSLDEICDKFNYSKSYLCKTFKKYKGESLILFFNKMKIEEAKRLLEKTNQNITSITYSLGFQEPKYFDYLFKKHVGVTPVLYRKNARRR